MCGIWGVSYGPGGPEAEEWTPEEFAQIIFPAIVHRGPHAWGWMSYDGGETISTYKESGRADTKKAIRHMAVDPHAKWIVGHVRYATHGSPENLINNHPILHGNILGVHNGVIRNHASILSTTGRENPETEVDSEAIFAAVDRWGHKDGLDKIKGDMVAVYVDRRFPNTLRIARTVGRPLVMCKTPTDATFFASEESCIDATGIEHSEFSSVSGYRLLNLKDGKITKRVNLREDMPIHLPAINSVSVVRTGHKVPTSNPVLNHNPVGWHRPHYSDEAATALSPRAEEIRQQIMREARKDELAHEGTKVGRIERMPRQNQIIKDDGCYEDGLYWLDGRLVDLDTYVDSFMGEDA